jgi:hypothetical protein
MQSAQAVTLPSLQDRFGTAVPVVIRDAVAEDGAPATDASAGSAIAQTIAQVWRDVLPAGDVAPNENFFDAGGTSLLVATASRKLQDALGRPVSMTDIYRFPTIRLLTAHYAGQGSGEAAALDESEERGAARRAQRMARRRRAT